MTGTTTTTVPWDSLVDEGNGPRQKEISYEFSNGRQFKEPFDPEGEGIYEESGD